MLQMSVRCTEKYVCSLHSQIHSKFLLSSSQTSRSSHGCKQPDHTLWSCMTDLLTYTGPFTHSKITDLHISELGGSPQKTLWQLCQLVVAEMPGELRHQTGVRGYTLHMLTKTRLAASEIAVLIITYRTQSTKCSVNKTTTIWMSWVSAHGRLEITVQ